MRILSYLFLIVPVVFLCSCGAKQPEQTSSVTVATPTAAGPESNTRLPSFSEDIQTTVKSLHLQAGETTSIPVVAHNTGSAPWSPFGRAPETISYKWFEKGKMLPIEGERTVLPGPVKAGDSISLQIKVVAPPKTGDLVLKIGMVQEGVTWFMTAGGATLDLPAAIR